MLLKQSNYPGDNYLGGGGNYPGEIILGVIVRGEIIRETNALFTFGWREVHYIVL